ncbi:MAG: hypothetical protein FWF84_01235 [Kiritimatiellaeota bacterium]|nr:hypothetical protein [Kiritimatiellota bacterium]
MKITVAKPGRPCQNHRMGRRLPWIILAAALSCGNALGDALGNGAPWGECPEPDPGARSIALALLVIAATVSPFLLPALRILFRHFASLPRPTRALVVAIFSAVALLGGQKGAQPKLGTDPNTLLPPVIAGVPAQPPSPPVTADAPAQVVIESAPAKQPSAPSRQSLLPWNFVPGMRPAWWHHSMEDSCGCGIPDLWRKWVRLDPCGHDLDRDGDGLTELEEWWFQCDPRTASTMGHGIHDGWLVARGINPLDPGVASWPCPNGLTLLETFLFGVEPDDPIPPIALSNGVNEVTFSLGQRVGQGDFAVFTIDNQRVPMNYLRDTVSVLFPETGVFQGSFERMAGMEGVGLTISGHLDNVFLYDPEGIFGEPTPPPPGMMAPLSRDGGPRFEIDCVGFGIDPREVNAHFVQGHPFTATNLAGQAMHYVTWTCDHGSFDDGIATGTTVNFTTFRDATITATVPLASNGTVKAYAHVRMREDDNDDYSPPTVAVSATDNFSPHLGETCEITVTCTPGRCACAGRGLGVRWQPSPAMAAGHS